jgi:hypothetical protein
LGVNAEGVNILTRKKQKDRKESRCPDTKICQVGQSLPKAHDTIASKWGQEVAANCRILGRPAKYHKYSYGLQCNARQISGLLIMSTPLPYKDLLTACTFPDALSALKDQLAQPVQFMRELQDEVD